jgi:hypothetical protein
MIDSSKPPPARASPDMRGVKFGASARRTWSSGPREGFAPLEKLFDRIGLVAVGYDRPAFKQATGR